MATLQPENSLHRELLLTKDSFIGYCHQKVGDYESLLTEYLDESFLSAIEKEELISPLFEGVDGKTGIMTTYYSPFQIVIILALRENIIDKEGNLRSPDDMSWQEERGTRSIRWQGHSSINIENKFEEGYSPWLICKRFHQFLLLLHSFGLDQKYEDPNLSRYYTFLPPLYYDFSTLTKDSLEIFNLKIGDLERLRYIIASQGMFIDPLKDWYDYIEKHPTYKKDLLQGNASSAQRCYEVCNLISSILERVTGEKQRSLTYYLKLGSPLPYSYIEKDTYVQGDDTWALRYTIDQLNNWVSEPSHKQFISEDEIQKIEKVKADIDDYIQRYGNKSWAGNHIKIEIDPNITLEGLDTQSRFWLENFRQQAKEGNWEFDEAEEIANQIHSRLSHLQRDLRAVLYEIQAKWRKESHDIWDKEERIDVWSRYYKDVATLTRQEQIAFMDKKRKETREKIDFWDNLAKDFYLHVTKFVDLAFCKVCHKKPIEVHIGHNDRSSTSIYESVICDSCKDTAPTIYRKEDLPAGFNCRKCDKLIFHYVHDNHFFATEKVVLTEEEQKGIRKAKKQGKKAGVTKYHQQSIEVKYGRVNCVVTCGYCDTVNDYQLDYGWRE